MTPSAIVKHLDQYVVGQTEAKKILAVAVYTHFRKAERSLSQAIEIAKSNILLIGSTGTGKTLLCETLSRALSVPFVTADAASLAQTEYVNNEIEAILQRLLDKASGDTARAERGIVFIDEVDKLKAVSGQSRAASGESVQHALLKIMEGSQVRLRTGTTSTPRRSFSSAAAHSSASTRYSRTRSNWATSRFRRTTTSASSRASTRASSRPTCCSSG